MSAAVQRDLFGQEVVRVRHTRAYAGTPGRGPEGRTCKHCAHYCRVKYHNKIYRKCALLRNAWTHGPGTDIKASTPACQHFEAAAAGPATAGGTRP